MRILFVNNIPFNPAYGGIERVTDILTKALKERGHEVFYLCFYIGEQQRKMLEYDSPAVLYILPNPGGFQINENLIFFKDLLDKLAIDIVVNQRGLSSEYNAILLHDKKCISVLHSIPDASLQTAYLNVMRYPQCLSEYIKYIIKLLLYPILCYRIKFIMEKTFFEQYSFITENSDAIVLLSDNYKKKFISYISKYHDKIIKGIPNPNTYSFQNLNLGVKEKNILYVGRLDSDDKCPMRLLKIWKRLYRKHHDWKLVIVGDGAERCAMYKYIKEYRLERVFLVGRKNNVEEYYRTASVVCLTSQYEGWGMALTEGMQFGCIPFTFNNYGAAYDIIDDGINGCLIPSFNLRAYAKRLSSLMSDENKRFGMALAAYNKSKMFDVSIIADQWEKLFYTILKSD